MLIRPRFWKKVAQHGQTIEDALYTKEKGLPNLRVMKVTKQMQTKADHFTPAAPENFKNATHPLKIFMKFDLLVELLFLIPNTPIFSKSAK